MVFVAFAANAQDQHFDPLQDRELYFDALHIGSTIAVIYLLSHFILQLVKNHLGHRLKARIIDKQVPELIVEQLLIPEKKERGQVFLQWCALLAAIAVGLMLIRVTLPFGLHSLAILAACIAGGCAFAYYLSRKGDPSNNLSK